MIRKQLLTSTPGMGVGGGGPFRTHNPPKSQKINKQMPFRTKNPQQSQKNNKHLFFSIFFPLEGNFAIGAGDGGGGKSQ